MISCVTRIAQRLAINITAVLALVFGTQGCSSVSDFLTVDPPAGMRTDTDLDNRSGAEALYAGAKVTMFRGLASRSSLIKHIGLFTDEFIDGNSFNSKQYYAQVDARTTDQAPEFSEVTSDGFQTLSGGRSELLLAIPKLLTHEPPNLQYRVGEAYALVGYIELFLAEAYCAGVTLDRILPDGGWYFGRPLTTDSLLRVAESHFDSALAHAHGKTDVIALAQTGKARAYLGRKQFPAAATAAALVPDGFVYNIESDPRMYEENSFYGLSVQGFCSDINTGDNEGGTGLNFRSANDARLALDTTRSPTCARLDDPLEPPFYYPVKFGTAPQYIPMASGIEARLIAAEAALQAGDPSWLTKLNALRTSCALGASCPTPAPAGLGNVSGLSPLEDPGTAALPPGKTAFDVRVDLLFRERAFWLFGTGTRLGDLRRLIRQYGRTAESIFPTGVYFGGLIPNLGRYGTDVTFTLPTPTGSYPVNNPHYQGCLTSTRDA